MNIELMDIVEQSIVLLTCLQKKEYSSQLNTALHWEIVFILCPGWLFFTFKF